MKEENIKKINDVIQTNNITNTRKELRRILVDEIRSLEISSEELVPIIQVFEQIDIPLKIKTKAFQVQSEKDYKSSIPTILSSLSAVALYTLLPKKSIINGIVAFAGAAFAGWMAQKKLGSSSTPDTPKEKEEVIISTSSEIAGAIDGIVRLISTMAIKQPESLSTSFPNVLKWYQQAYASSGDYGEECEKYFKKRIESILRQCHCELHNYNGNNAEFFEKTEDYTVHEITQYLPAITGEKGYILPGVIYIPKKV